jgi:hypothetical protein
VKKGSQHKTKSPTMIAKVFAATHDKAAMRLHEKREEKNYENVISAQCSLEHNSLRLS